MVRATLPTSNWSYKACTHSCACRCSLSTYTGPPNRSCIVAGTEPAAGSSALGSITPLHLALLLPPLILLEEPALRLHLQHKAMLLCEAHGRRPETLTMLLKTCSTAFQAVSLPHPLLDDHFLLLCQAALLKLFEQVLSPVRRQKQGAS